jgi:hypothetical protein
VQKWKNRRNFATKKFFDMNVTTEKVAKGVELRLKVAVNEADYATEVDKSLKEYRRKANVPGFRPGMVPMGVINKMYRKGVVAEQAYRKANEAVFKYLEDNKIEIMGDVMPSDAQGELSFDEGTTEHEFVFEVGLAPKIDVEISGDKMTKYNIKSSKELHERYMKGFLRGFSKHEKDAPEGAEPTPPTLDEAFFKLAFPDGSVTDKAGLDKFIDQRIADDMARESSYLFDIQLKNMVLAKANPTLPEEFLKRWLHAVNEGKFTMEEIEKDLPAFLRMMSWNLIQRHFAEKFDIKIEQDDLLAEAKNVARMQFAQYGMAGVPDETIEGFAKNILSNREEAQRIYERALEEKVLTALKPLVKVSEKSVSVEDFQKLASEA